MHGEITYLNEPRRLWYSAYPETDIWTRKARRRNGRLYLDRSHIDPRKTAKLRRSLYFEKRLGRGPVLIEKLPANTFRLDFLKGMFPDCRFIHIYRNGLEVAQSIEQRAIHGRWFGHGQYKWHRLVEHASRYDRFACLPALCGSDFERGLLEWRLSTETAVDYLAALPGEDYIECSYRHLLEHTDEVIGDLLAFLGVPSSPDVLAFGRERLERSSRTFAPADIGQSASRIGGEILQSSMVDDRGLTTVRAKPESGRVGNRVT